MVFRVRTVSNPGPGPDKVGAIIVAFLATASVLSGSAQTRGASGSSAQGVTISGRVIDGVSGVGIEGATVSVVVGQSRRSSVTEAATETDAAGRFALRDTKAGSVRIQASKSNYIGGLYGQVHPRLGSGNLEVQDGPNGVEIVLRLWRQAVIAGHVRDANDQPVVGAEVLVLRQIALGGHKRLVPEPALRIHTDDRGSYRVGGLAAGSYTLAVSAAEGGAKLVRDGSVLYPGVQQPAAARTFALEYGDEREHTDIVLPPNRTGIIAGKLAGATGMEFPEFVELFGQELDSEWDLPIARVPVGTDGQFRFQPVVPGIFLVKARRFPPTSSSVFQSGIGVVLGTPGTVVPIMSTAPTLWADWTGEIKPGLNQVAMSMRHGARIAGRVQLDSDLARRITLKDLFGTAVIVSRADGGPLGTLPLGRIEADGTFRTAEVPPGKYSVMVPIRLNDVSVDSIRSGSRQAIGSYLEVGDQDTEDVVVNLTGSLAAISGHVSQPGKNPVSVYAFPTDRALWRDYGLSATLLRSVQAATDGSYALDLLPGSYHIVAGPTGIDQWRDVDSLQKFVGASVVVRLVRSERRQQDLIVR